MKKYDVIIIGAGVTGSALAYTLSEYTNIKKILVLEKYSGPAMVNSNSKNNSQTLHFGDIETNYTLEKARKVKAAAELVKNYVEKNNIQGEVFSKYNKMVLAVGDKEIKELKERYKEFKELFPELREIECGKIAEIESKLVEGRKFDEKLFALTTDEGYIIDYQKLSESFLSKSKKNGVEIIFNNEIKKIEKNENYLVKTNKGEFKSKFVVVAAGAYSLLFAKSLGYGENYALLSVAGSFYFSENMLNGKVYTVQDKKLPFAAIHGDPEFHDKNKTRFGPTAKILPMLERYNYKSFYDYFRTAGLSLRAFNSFFKILSDKTILFYMLRNFVYDFPIIGKRLFIKEVKKIVPSIKLSDLKFAKGYGGIRPQIINLETKKLEMGAAKIPGDKIIFNITPSPGASTCLKNAHEDTIAIVDALWKDFEFNKKKFERDLF